MHDFAGCGRNGSFYSPHSATWLQNENPTIAYLTTSLRVERRAIKYYLTPTYSHDRRWHFERFSPNEFRPGQRLIERIDLRLLRALPACAGPSALLLHLRGKTFAVDGDAQLPRHVLLFFQRKPIGVVEFEAGGSHNGTALGLVTE